MTRNICRKVLATHEKVHGEKFTHEIVFADRIFLLEQKLKVRNKFIGGVKIFGRTISTLVLSGESFKSATKDFKHFKSFKSFERVNNFL